MSLTELAKAASEAKDEIKTFSDKHGHQPWMESVLSQMDFIEEKSLNGMNPVKCLHDDEEFTYGIISSRELASPEEMIVKKKLNRVSEIMRKIWV